jgi:hypothetical protein
VPTPQAKFLKTLIRIGVTAELELGRAALLAEAVPRVGGEETKTDVTLRPFLTKDKNVRNVLDILDKRQNDFPWEKWSVPK